MIKKFVGVVLWGNKVLLGVIFELDSRVVGMVRYGFIFIRNL